MTSTPPNRTNMTGWPGPLRAHGLGLASAAAAAAGRGPASVFASSIGPAWFDPVPSFGVMGPDMTAPIAVAPAGTAAGQATVSVLDAAPLRTPGSVFSACRNSSAD